MRRLFLLIAIPFIISCAPGVLLKTAPVDEEGVEEAVYTLVLYGGGYRGDLESIAFMDLEGDKYDITPYGPDYMIRRIPGQSPKEALVKAESFLRSLYSYRQTLKRRILDSEGQATVGYELRPLYLPFEYGRSDVLDVSYSLRPAGGKGNAEVRAYIRIKREVEEILSTRESDD